MRRRRILVLSFAALALVAGCSESGAKTGDTAGSNDSGPGTTFDIPKDELVDKTGEASVTIVSVDNTLEPQYVEITAGTQVVFTNEGRNAHNIVPDVEGAFQGIEQADFPAGASYSVVFDKAGDFPYFCSVHGTMKHGMNGAIRVVAAK